MADVEWVDGRAVVGGLVLDLARQESFDGADPVPAWMAKRDGELVAYGTAPTEDRAKDAAVEYARAKGVQDGG